MAAQEGLQQYHPDWHQLLMDIQHQGQVAYDQLVRVVMEPTPAIVVQGFVDRFPDATREVYPVLADLKNSLSNNINAKVALKRKVTTAVEVASALVDGIVVLHGVDPAAAYQTMYTIVRPRISSGHLHDEDRDVLVKVFRKFSCLNLTVNGVEDEFLARNPAYADGSKQKRDAHVAVHKVIVAGLLESLPKGYATNTMFQELIGARFNAFMAALEPNLRPPDWGPCTRIR